MNLARIKLMAYMLHALCVVQTVSLHKLASAMPTSVERDSNLRRIQRFIANYASNLDLVARMIFSLLPVSPPQERELEHGALQFPQNRTGEILLQALFA